jgi:pyrimidine-nucleoside phosphorylase
VNPTQIIAAKRDGGAVPTDRLEAFLRGYLDGAVAEYQMSAFLMAVVFRGMTSGELDVLVRVMVESGATLDLDHVAGAKVDKHSTGGVGDKVSLALAPLAAELGVRVPMMSGRGLGHTTGTLDKLEAIPGFCTDLTLERFVHLLDEVGCAMIGQTAEIAPLDRRLYDLRSVTGTVPCIPLIAASIMSKKLAEGLDALLLDVKVGDGAFLPEEERALELARTMVEIGEARGVSTVALLTAMDRPLGRAVGNALETREALECLHGGGPDDLRQLVIREAVEMTRLAAASGELAVEDADEVALRRRAGKLLDSGAALARMRRMVEAQGGDPGVVDDPTRLGRAASVADWTAPRAGIVTAIHPRALGQAVVEMGGGRTRLGQEIDLTVGFELAVSPGDRVKRGALLARIHARDSEGEARGRNALQSAIVIGEEEPTLRPLVSHRVTRADIGVPPRD